MESGKRGCVIQDVEVTALSDCAGDKIVNLKRAIVGREKNLHTSGGNFCYR